MKEGLVALFSWLHRFIISLIQPLDLGTKTNVQLSTGIQFVLLLIIAWLLVYVVRVTMSNFIIRLTSKSKYKHFLRTLIFNKGVLKISQLISLALLATTLPLVLAPYKSLSEFTTLIINLFIIYNVTGVISRILNSLVQIGYEYPGLRDKPIASYKQVIVIIVYIIAGVVVFSEITGKSIGTFLTAMGAFSAILLLVFKDTILGFVASIQVTTNDMVRIGDWIEMSKFGANGDVIEINLTTVKVRNLDKTITTIPTYMMVSDSFKNYRGMQEARGRRIMRKVHININSVRFLTDVDIEKLSQIQILTKYLKERKQTIEQYNISHKIDTSIPVNGRNLTNLGVFRQYIENYLKRHQRIKKNFHLMVRQQESTNMGIPLEIYCFTNTTILEEYEAIAADVFDHIIAVAPYFDIEIYQAPSGKDFDKIIPPTS